MKTNTIANRKLLLFTVSIIITLTGCTAVPPPAVVQTTNQPPILRIEPVAPLIQGEFANLDASGSSDPDNDSLFFSWSLDGGESILSTEQAFRHQFITPDIYVVQLTLSDGKQETTDAIKVICVESDESIAIDDPYSYLTAYEHISSKYIGDFAGDTLMKGSIARMIEALNDPYAHYYTTAQLEKFRDDVEGKLSGIGVYLTPAEEYPKILGVIPASPAEASGELIGGDLIVKVDGEDLVGKSFQDAVDLIKGPEGTPVTLTIRREGRKDFDVTITRAQILIPSVSEADVVESTIGYVRLDSYMQTNMVSEVKEKLQELQGKGARRFILDLRNNGGGLVTNALGMAALFLEREKIITTTYYKNDWIWYINRADPLFTGNIVILQNRYTASASEIFVGAMKDRAYIIGETSFGKGVMQSTYELPNGRAIQFTIGEYIIPDGSKVDGVGISPDETITPSQQDTTPRSEEDEIYQAALDYFKNLP